MIRQVRKENHDGKIYDNDSRRSADDNEKENNGRGKKERRQHVYIRKKKHTQRE